MKCITDIKTGAKAYEDNPDTIDKRKAVDRSRHHITLVKIAKARRNAAPSGQLQNQEPMMLARDISTDPGTTTQRPPGVANASGFVEERAEEEQAGEIDQYNIQELEEDDRGEIHEEEQRKEDRRGLEVGSRGEADNEEEEDKENDDEDVIIGVKEESKVDVDDDVIFVKEEKTCVTSQTTYGIPHKQPMAKRAAPTGLAPIPTKNPLSERAKSIGLAPIGSVFYDPTDTDIITALEDALVVARADLAARRRSGMTLPWQAGVNQKTWLT